MSPGLISRPSLSVHPVSPRPAISRVSPGLISRPSLSARRRFGLSVQHRAVSPGLISRPSLSGQPGSRRARRGRSVAGLNLPAFVERRKA